MFYELDYICRKEFMKLTEVQSNFIWLAYAENKKFDEISNTLQVDRETLAKWNLELVDYWRPIAEIKNLHRRKKIKQPIKDFYDRIQELEKNKRCVYCNVSEEELSIIKPETKRNRGKKLELERQLPGELYDNLANLAYACYWCNNAKTDTFTYDEFIEVGKTIGDIWKKRLNK